MSGTPLATHAVVLAAGRGSRLGDHGTETPKWLLEVGGRTIADRQLEGLRAASPEVASVHVVVGHAAEAIEHLVAGREEAIRVVRNPEFAELNNWWSLLLALRRLPEEGPVTVINADLVVAPEHLTAFLRDAASGEAEAMMAVDLERALTDESMKVSRRRDGALDRIGKVGVEAPVGEYVGMLTARGDALRSLRETLESFVGRSECVNEWYEGAVGRSAAGGAAWELWPMPNGGWVEVDDHSDLDAAEALVAGA